MAEDLPAPGELDRVLVNPKRFMIATILYLRGPTTVATLQRMLDISWGDLDRQLRTLKSHGYVVARKVPTREGLRTLVELTGLGRERYEATLELLDRIIGRARGSQGSG